MNAKINCRSKITRRRFLRVEMLEVRAVPTAGVFRFVIYNTANDVSGNNNVDYLPRSGMGDVLQAIAALNVSGSSQPIDILALQESVYYTGTGINPTAQGFVNLLNSTFPGNSYAAATVNGATDSNSTGNGPQTLVYRSSALQLVSQQALGTPSGTGIPRQVMEYKFQPIGYPASTAFYVFNSHMKSGTSSSDNTRRGMEATLINSMADGLPANTPIIYLGDYNPTNSTSDLGYGGVIAGSGSKSNHAIDPLDPTNAAQNWSQNTALAMETESPATSAAFTGESTGGMNYRDDVLLNSVAATSGTNIQYVGGSYVSFGNTGTHTFQGAVSTGSASALAAELSGYTTTQASKVLTELTQVADHLPVVADYHIVVPPTITGTQINDGSAQRSMITSLTVTFSQPVTLPANPATAFTLTRQSDNANVTLNAAVSGNSVTLTFTGGAVDNASLADGRYTLTALASQINGGKFDGNGDGVTGDDYVLASALTPNPPTNIFRLFGDVDGNGSVDASDFIVFRQNFGGYLFAFDFDGDDSVSASDFIQFRLRFGGSI
jgi:hypothetical protein